MSNAYASVIVVLQHYAATRNYCTTRKELLAVVDTYLMDLQFRACISMDH